MLVVTTNDVAGFRITEVLGQAFGLVVRSRGLGGNLVAGLRSLVGGEIVEYTQMLEEARRHAVDRLVENASLMGADAVIAMRFDSSEIGETMTEVIAYGTAVRMEPLLAVREPAPEGSYERAHASASASSEAFTGAVPGAPGTFGHRTHTP